MHYKWQQSPLGFHCAPPPELTVTQQTHVSDPWMTVTNMALRQESAPLWACTAAWAPWTTTASSRRRARSGSGTTYVLATLGTGRRDATETQAPEFCVGCLSQLHFIIIIIIIITTTTTIIVVKIIFVIIINGIVSTYRFGSKPKMNLGGSRSSQEGRQSRH